MAVKTQTTVRVLYADTDQMKVVYHAKYLEWFEHGRTEMLRELGVPYTRVEKEGFMLPVVEVYIQYRLPALYDELLTIVTIVDELPDIRFRLDYEVINPHQKIITRGYTVHSFVNRSGKPVKPPAWLVKVFQRALASSS